MGRAVAGARAGLLTLLNSRGERDRESVNERAREKSFFPALSRPPLPTVPSCFSGHALLYENSPVWASRMAGEVRPPAFATSPFITHSYTTESINECNKQESSLYIYIYLVVQV